VLLVAAQILATALSCYGLWRLLRIISGYGRIPALIVGLGFSVRAILSVALFWISYFRLPLGRSLQLGPGFWFYGLDAEFYFGYALETIRSGPLAIFHVSPSYPARGFVQLITLFVQLFGPVPSVGILLNCFTYVGICLLIARIGTHDARITPVTTAALAAISFGPAAILNSTQMLKDPFFQFLLVVAIVVSLKWHELWTSPDVSGKRRAAGLAVCALLLLGCVYAIATIRWYFAILLMMSCTVLFLWQMIAARQHVAAIVVNVLMLMLIARYAEAGGLDDIPQYVRDMLHIRTAPRAILSLPQQVAGNLESVRVGFELTPGATNIQAGTAIAQTASAPPPPPPLPPVVVDTAPPPAVTSASMIETEEPRHHEEPAPVVATTTTIAAQETTTTTIAAQETTTTTLATETGTPPAVTTTMIAENTTPPPAAETTTTQAPAPARAPAAVPVDKPKKLHRRKAPVPAKPVVVAEQAKPQPVAPPPVLPAPVQPAPAIAVPAAPGPSLDPSLTTKQRFFSSIAATLVPRAIAQKLGWIRVGGGRGFWFFADLDTIAFDIVLFFAVITCARQLVRSRFRMTPMFVQVVLLFMIAALPLIYAIANFGTLFRHRQMIYLGLCLLPVALGYRHEKREQPPEPAAM